MKKISVKTKNRKLYRIHLKRDPEGGYVVTVPALRGCVTWGKNQAEALDMAREAIQGFLEALSKEGAKLPEDRSISRIHESLVQVRIPSA